MNETCNLPPESHVAGMGLATFLARRVGKLLTPAFLVGVVLSVPSSAQIKFSIVGKMPITLPFELIDNRVFVEVDITVDYTRHQLVFEKNRHYGRRDSYDRAGLWMGQDGDRFTVVDVIAGGPAAQAGVQQGESILAIDGISTSKLVLPDVRERIRRAKVGTKITLLVESKGEQRRVTIVLRDLV